MIYLSDKSSFRSQKHFKMNFLQDKDRPGFFKDYYTSVRKSVQNDQFNEFCKLKSDESRVRFLLKLPSVHDIDIKSFYKGKSEREALERKEAGNKAFIHKNNLEALKLYSQAVVKAPVPSGKYWKLIS